MDTYVIDGLHPLAPGHRVAIQTRDVQRIFEVGSSRSYLIPGKMTMGTLAVRVIHSTPRDNTEGNCR
jgi:hypothetical protein